MIRMSHLTKQFGPLTALKDLSLEVPKGEIFGFLGPNGAGKTTTLKIMAGVLAPTAGDVTIGGFSILKEPAQAKAITGYIPDRPFLYDKLTGLEFLHFVGGLYGLLPTEIDKEMESRLNLFDLWDWRDELIESYSHGMKQRLIIIAALILGSAVVINSDVPPILFGVSVIGIAGFVAAAVLGIWLLIAIIQKGRL